MPSWNPRGNRRTLGPCLVPIIGLLVVLAAAETWAASVQSRGASLAGVLEDPTGRRLPLSPVVLIQAGTGRKITQQTNASGQFAFSDLPAGEYRLEVQQSGFVSDQGAVKLEPGQRLERNVTLQVGSIAETVMVRMARAQAEAGPDPQRSPNRPRAVDPCGQSAPAGCLTPPGKLVDVLPVYPPAHLKNGVSGQVVVVGRVGTDGRLEALEPEAGSDPAFTKATLEALQSWKYSPARLSGVPVTCRIVVTTIFGQ